MAPRRVRRARAAAAAAAAFQAAVAAKADLLQIEEVSQKMMSNVATIPTVTNNDQIDKNDKTYANMVSRGLLQQQQQQEMQPQNQKRPVSTLQAKQNQTNQNSKAYDSTTITIAKKISTEDDQANEKNHQQYLQAQQLYKNMIEKIVEPSITMIPVAKSVPNEENEKEEEENDLREQYLHEMKSSPTIGDNDFGKLTIVLESKQKAKSGERTDLPVSSSLNPTAKNFKPNLITAKVKSSNQDIKKQGFCADKTETYPQLNDSHCSDNGTSLTEKNYYFFYTGEKYPQILLPSNVSQGLVDESHNFDHQMTSTSIATSAASTYPATTNFMTSSPFIDSSFGGPSSCMIPQQTMTVFCQNCFSPMMLPLVTQSSAPMMFASLPQCQQARYFAAAASINDHATAGVPNAHFYHQLYHH